LATAAACSGSPSLALTLIRLADWLTEESTFESSESSVSPSTFVAASARTSGLVTRFWIVASSRCVEVGSGLENRLVSGLRTIRAVASYFFGRISERSRTTPVIPATVIAIRVRLRCSAPT
jgi:hypothetical protein